MSERKDTVSKWGFSGYLRVPPPAEAPAPSQTEPRQGININSHPLIRQSYEVSLAIEECAASEQQTAASIKSSALTTAISNLLSDDNYVAFLRWAGDTQHRHLVLCNSDDERAFKVYRWPRESQAAQTVASLTAESPTEWRMKQPYYAYDQFTEDGESWVRTDRVDRWLADYSIGSDYAATLEARVTAQKNIIATLGEGKAAAEERAEKAEARVGELERTPRFDEKKHIERMVAAGCAIDFDPETLDLIVTNERADALAVSLRDVGEKFTTIASDSSWMLKNLVEAQLIPNCDKVEIVERLNELEEVLSRLSTDTKEEK